MHTCSAMQCNFAMLLLICLSDWINNIFYMTLYIKLTCKFWSWAPQILFFYKPEHRLDSTLITMNDVSTKFKLLLIIIII